MAFNILLVDDSATTRAVMAKTFRLTQVPIKELHQACNGQEALKILNDHWIDVVFTDINMAVMDGVELVTRMGEDGLLRTIPVVVVSIDGSTRRIDELKAKGISAFVRKPFTPELIQKVLEDVLRSRTQSYDPAEIGNVLCQILEQYAFMFGGPADKKDLPPCEAALKAVIHFTGRLLGRVTIAIPKSMGPLIAANVLGVEADDPLAVEKAEDALKELSNMTCGQLLTTIAGTEPVFDLDVPEVVSLDAVGWKAFLDEEETLLFMVDDRPMLLQFKVEG
jgi:two-component system, chemotaxis family, chemotaxis protein CheY